MSQIVTQISLGLQEISHFTVFSSSLQVFYNAASCAFHTGPQFIPSGLLLTLSVGPNSSLGFKEFWFPLCSLSHNLGASCWGWSVPLLLPLWSCQKLAAALCCWWFSHCDWITEAYTADCFWPTSKCLGQLTAPTRPVSRLQEGLFPV